MVDETQDKEEKEVENNDSDEIEVEEINVLNEMKKYLDETLNAIVEKISKPEEPKSNDKTNDDSDDDVCCLECGADLVLTKSGYLQCEDCGQLYEWEE